MIVCPDCRAELAKIGDPCQCGWSPRCVGNILDYLGSEDRTSTSTAGYIEAYDTLAEKNLLDPTISDRYVDNLARRFLAAIGSVNERDFCDVGSGRGYLVKHALRMSPRSVTAVDIAAPSLRDVVAKFGVPGFLANAEHLPFERHFDVLSATDIVEHVLNVSNFLVTANWALRDGGVLAVRVPYLENMIYYSNYYGLPMHFTHLRTFDRRTIVRMVEAFGFKVERIHYDGFFHTRTHSFLDRFPSLKLKCQHAILSCFKSADDVTTINPTLGHLLMRPVEIGVIARKTEHLQPVNVHKPLQDFYQEKGRYSRYERRIAS